MTKYAAGTEVAISRSRDEIEATLKRFGATAQVWMRDDAAGTVLLGFKRKGFNYKLSFNLPKITDASITDTPSGRWERSEKGKAEALEQETRRRFRSLALYVKAVLEAVETGIISEQEALLAYLLLPSGATVAEEVADAQQKGLLAGGQGLFAALEGPVKKVDVA